MDQTSIKDQPFAHIIQKFGKYWIYNKSSYNKDENYTGDPEKYIWYTIRDYEGSASANGYKIAENDVLKLGRARLKVLQIRTQKDAEGNPECNLKVTEKIEKCKLNSLSFTMSDKGKEIEDESNCCRICFMEGDADNPLISI